MPKAQMSAAEVKTLADETETRDMRTFFLQPRFCIELKHPDVVRGVEIYPFDDDNEGNGTVSLQFAAADDGDDEWYDSQKLELNGVTATADRAGTAFDAAPSTGAVGGGAWHLSDWQTKQNLRATFKQPLPAGRRLRIYWSLRGKQRRNVCFSQFAR